MTEGGCEMQWSPSLRVSVQSRGTMFQQSKYTALTAQHGLQEKSRFHLGQNITADPQVFVPESIPTALCNAVNPFVSAASDLAPFSNRMWTQSVWLPRAASMRAVLQQRDFTFHWSCEVIRSIVQLQPIADMNLLTVPLYLDCQ